METEEKTSKYPIKFIMPQGFARGSKIAWDYNILLFLLCCMGVVGGIVIPLAYHHPEVLFSPISFFLTWPAVIGFFGYISTIRHIRTLFFYKDSIQVKYKFAKQKNTEYTFKDAVGYVYYRYESGRYRTITRGLFIKFSDGTFLRIVNNFREEAFAAARKILQENNVKSFSKPNQLPPYWSYKKIYKQFEQ